MKCIKCGISINEVPEDATYEELLCNQCYDIYENLSILRGELEDIILNFRARNDICDDIEITGMLIEEIYEDLQDTSDSFMNHECQFSVADIDASFKRVIVRAINKSFK